MLPRLRSPHNSALVSKALRVGKVAAGGGGTDISAVTWRTEKCESQKGKGRDAYAMRLLHLSAVIDFRKYVVRSLEYDTGVAIAKR